MQSKASSLQFRLALSFLFAIALTACGGGGGAGGGATSPLPGVAPTNSPLPMNIISRNGSNIELTGTVVDLISGGFTIQGGTAVGYLHIYTNSSTVISGPAPYIGENVDVVGTGSPDTSVTATKVSPLGSPTSGSAPTPPAIGTYTFHTSGPIVAILSASEFQINGGAGVGYLNVYTNGNTTKYGSAVSVGLNADVYGNGSAATSVTATWMNIGNGSSTTPPATPTPGPVVTSAPSTPTPSPVSTTAPSGAAITLPSNVSQVSGNIVDVTSSRLTIDAGAGCGYMYVYLNSGTTYFNGAPQLNQYGVFTGTGTRCASVTANTVSLSSSPATSGTFTGTVASQTAYGFKLGTSGSTVPVALTSSTVVFGGTLAVGSNVTVTALGTTATGLTASQVAVSTQATPAPASATTPGPISMTHVQNFAYIYGYAGVPTTVPLSSMTPWVNWTITDANHAAQIRNAGIKVQVYANFWRNYASDNPIIGYTDLAPGGAHAAAEAKDCSGSAIYDSSYGGGYEADARSSAAFGHAQTVTNYVTSYFGSNYDALFSDDTGAVGGITSPCGYSQSAYDAAVNSVHSALGTQMFINALGAFADPSSATDLVQPSNVLGAMCEECYSSNGSGDTIQTGTTWQNVENAEINTVAQKKIFWLYARATGSAASEPGIRMYTYASFLISYDPNYAMFHEALSTPSGFPVMPETGLVATNPLTTATSVSGYQAPGGSYFREFANCYYRGAFVNRCAVVVNPTAGSVPVPSTSYSHSMVLSGAGVLDGGSVSFTGGSVSSLASGTAAILFP